MLRSILRWKVRLLVDHVRKKGLAVVEAADQSHVAYQSGSLSTLSQVIKTIDRLGKMLIVHLKCLGLLRLHDGSRQCLGILFHHKNSHVWPVDFLRISVVLLVLVKDYFVAFGIVVFVDHVNVAGAGVASVSMFSICMIARVW